MVVKIPLCDKTLSDLVRWKAVYSLLCPAASQIYDIWFFLLRGCHQIDSPVRKVKK